MVEAVALHRAGPEVVGDDVAVLHELQEHVLARGRRDLQAEALLVARAEVREVRALVPPLRTGLAVGERSGLAVLEMLDAFDADHLCPEVREESGAPRQRVHLLEREHPNALQEWRCHRGAHR